VATKQSCIFHNVCFLPDGASKTLTVVRLQGSTSTGVRGAERVLQQQLNTLLQGLYNVHVFSPDEVMLDQASSASNSSNLSLGPGSIPYKLWRGLFDLGGGRPEAVHLSRSPANGQPSNSVLLLEDKLTVISKAGVNQV
jgi:hypothetical protein